MPCNLVHDLSKVGGVRMKTRVLLPLIALAIATALTLPARSADAVPMGFFANLSGANEVPPIVSPGTGFGTVVLDPDAHTLQLDVTFSGLTSNTTAAHIHCCQPLGTNAGVATTLPAFEGFPLGVTSGTYSSPVFLLTEPLIYNPAFVTAQGGLPQAEAALIAGIVSGMSYLNIHSEMFGPGEIRDQLHAVPEPATLLLWGSAAAALGLARWRRRQGQ
jgi:CHRD domain